MAQSREQMFKALNDSFQKPTKAEAERILNEVSKSQEGMLKRIHASTPSNKNSEKLYTL